MLKNEPKEIIIHHTADGWNGLQFKKVNNFHRTEGYPISSLGFYCGYHYFIERNGELRQARNDNDKGAHTKGQNLRSIGIGLAGNFNFEVPSEEQKEALGKLCADLMKKHGIKIMDVQPHRKYAFKDCPGTNLKDDWAQYAILQQQVNLLYKLLLWIKIQLGY